MSDPLIPGWLKLAFFGGAVTAMWTVTGMPPAPWYARGLYYCFLMSMVFVVAQAVAAFYPALPAGAYGIVGAMVPVVIINLLIWLRGASKDPIGALKQFMSAKGGRDDN